MFIAVSAVLTVFTVSGNAETAFLASKEAELLEKQESLKGGLVDSISVSGLGRKAEELGFVESGDPLYVGEVSVVASLTRE